MINRIDQNITDFRKSTLDIENFLTGTILSYSFFKDKFPEIQYEFGEKERTEEEKEGMKIFSNLSDKISEYQSDIYTISFINLIARTEAFLNDILETLFIWKKQSLIADKSVSYKEIIECENIDELIDKIRAKEVLEFSHASFKDKINYLKKKFKLKLPLIEEKMQSIIELFTTRNIILHNNSIVNETYLNINKDSQFQLGEKRILNETYIKLTFVLIIIIAKSIEESIKEKMNN